MTAGDYLLVVARWSWQLKPDPVYTQCPCNYQYFTTSHRPCVVSPLEYCSYVPLPSPFQLLGYIHQQKNQKGVSEMILRLYNPFLWRALKVANPHVRANAASLLFDAFPLQEPSSTREEIDLGMQKQFDAMMV